MRPLTLCAAVLLAACTPKNTAVEPTVVADVVVGSPGLDALVWTQASAERDAVARQAYRAAASMIDAALADPTWTASPADQGDDFADKPPAIILDIDETVLDNSTYQARNMRDGKSYDLPTWNAWCDEAAATEIPGAVWFTTLAAEKGVRVFFLSNRRASTEAPTRSNLAALGFPLTDELDTVILRGEKPEWDTSDKTTRRQHITAGHRVIMLFGDNMGDFVLEEKLSVAGRRAAYETHLDWWGERWFALPNPLYGTWESAVLGYDHSLDAGERVRRKEAALRY